MRNYTILIFVIFFLSGCQSDEAKFKQIEKEFVMSWNHLYGNQPIVLTAIYDVDKLKDEKPFLDKTITELDEIDAERFSEINQVEFFAIKNLVESRIDFLESKIPKDPTVFSLQNELEIFINEEDKSGEEISKNLLRTLERFPKFYDFAKMNLNEPDLQKVNIALEEEKVTYFLLKNELTEWNEKNGSTTLAKNHFTKINEDAKLAIKDWIAFLTSAKFEIGD